MNNGIMIKDLHRVIKFSIISFLSMTVLLFVCIGIHKYFFYDNFDPYEATMRSKQEFLYKNYGEIPAQHNDKPKAKTGVQFI